MMRELTPVDDSHDTRFQPPLESYSQELPLSEGYRLGSSLNIVPSISMPVGKEALYVRRKRDSGSLSTIAMDGSGTTEEESRFFLIYYFSTKRKT
jgi:hypothetical protein